MACAAAISSSAAGLVGRSAPVTVLVSGKPAARATAATVPGASPDITFRSTPSRRRYATTSAASGRIRSRSTASPSGVNPGGVGGHRAGAVQVRAATTARPNTSTRDRSPWRRDTSVASGPAPSTSGAPRISTSSRNAAPDHFQRDANGTSASVSSGEPPSAAAIASDVPERTLPAAATRASVCRAARLRDARGRAPPRSARACRR